MRESTTPSGFGELRDRLFDSDLRIKRQNIPWLTVSCAIALAGSMLFGIFFGQREAQSVHAGERAATIAEFAKVAAEKDAQIQQLTKVIIKSQADNIIEINRLNKSDIVIKKYLIEQSKVLGISGDVVEDLREQVNSWEQEMARKDESTPGQ